MMQKLSWRICFLFLSIGVVIAQEKPTDRSKEAEISPTSKIWPTSRARVESAVARSFGSRGQKFSSPVSAPSGVTSSTTTTTTTTALPTDDSGVVLYRQKLPNGNTCALIRVDALLVFKYTEISGDQTERDTYLPKEVTVTGTCSQEENSFLCMRWRSFAFNWYFAQTPGGDHWYIEKMELKFNTSDKFFPHFPKKGKAVTLTTQKDKKKMMFPTPMGKSYACDEETTVELKGSPDIEASVLLRNFKVQPFIWKSDNFGPEYVCSPGAGTYRDERAPLAVGSTLAVVVLLTVTGYGIYRYFKIKKVQYDTME